MARRKKELQSVHRKNISMAAEQLFMKNGIENTSMNDIAIFIAAFCNGLPALSAISEVSFQYPV